MRCKKSPRYFDNTNATTFNIENTWHSIGNFQSLKNAQIAWLPVVKCRQSKAKQHTWNCNPQLRLQLIFVTAFASCFSVLQVCDKKSVALWVIFRCDCDFGGVLWSWNSKNVFFSHNWWLVAYVAPNCFDMPSGNHPTGIETNTCPHFSCTPYPHWKAIWMRRMHWSQVLFDQYLSKQFRFASYIALLLENRCTKPNLNCHSSHAVCTQSPWPHVGKGSNTLFATCNQKWLSEAKGWHSTVMHQAAWSLLQRRHLEARRLLKKNDSLKTPEQTLGSSDAFCCKWEIALSALQAGVLPTPDIIVIYNHLQSKA